jgi:hypothetical protein
MLPPHVQSKEASVTKASPDANTVSIAFQLNPVRSDSQATDTEESSAEHQLPQAIRRPDSKLIPHYAPVQLVLPFRLYVVPFGEMGLDQDPMRAFPQRFSADRGQAGSIASP